MSILSSKSGLTLKSWLNNVVFRDKLNHPLGYLTLGGMALVFAALLAILPVKFAAIASMLFLGVMAVFGTVFNLHFGINLFIVASFLLGLALKYTSAPLGIALDGFLGLMILGLLLKLVRERDFTFAKNPISFWIAVWIFYNIFQVLNPMVESHLAWVFTVRTVALLLLSYFVSCYAFNSLKAIKSTILVTIFMAFAAGVYSLKQEWIGYSQTELTWLYSDPKRLELIFQWSRLRVFSFFFDPTTFGILMGYMAMFCVILATGPFQRWKRLALAGAAVPMVLGMAYAGSRTPIAMVPVGVVFYLILNFNKKVVLGIFAFFLIGTAFVMKSTGSAVVWRIQSAFKPGEDASVQVRLDNQALIQPYIQNHPIGAGLGTTGAWGKRFTPDSWLASFAHDSLFVRLAVESGYVGLFLYMILLMVAMHQSIYWYFRVHRKDIKIIYLALASNTFLLCLASYPQEAITLPPNSIIFYTTLAMIVRLKDFDELPAELEDGKRNN